MTMAASLASFALQHINVATAPLCCSSCQPRQLGLAAVCCCRHWPGLPAAAALAACCSVDGRSSPDSGNTAPSLGSLVLQRDDVAGGPASKQRPDQLHGHGLVALWTLIPTSIQQPTQNRIPRARFSGSLTTDSFQQLYCWMQTASTNKKAAQIADIEFVLAECARAQKLLSVTPPAEWKNLPRDGLIGSLPHPSGRGNMACSREAEHRIWGLAEQAVKQSDAVGTLETERVYRSLKSMLVSRFVKEARTIDAQQVGRALAGGGATGEARSE
jgi:hypothetical protein